MTGSYVNGGVDSDCATEFDNHDKQENENATQANEKVITVQTSNDFQTSYSQALFLGWFSSYNFGYNLRNILNPS